MDNSENLPEERLGNSRDYHKKVHDNIYRSAVVVHGNICRSLWKAAGNSDHQLWAGDNDYHSHHIHNRKFLLCDQIICVFVSSFSDGKWFCVPSSQ